MAVIPQTYSLRTSNIQMFKITDINETATWLSTNLPLGSTVDTTNIQYGFILFTQNGKTESVRAGDYLAQEGSGPIFKMPKDIAENLYALVP